MGSLLKRAAPPLVEFAHCPDIFASGLARIEKLSGGVLRFVFFADQITDEGQHERHVVARLVIPISEVPKAVRQTLEAINDTPFIAENGELLPLQ